MEGASQLKEREGRNNRAVQLDGHNWEGRQEKPGRWAKDRIKEQSKRQKEDRRGEEVKKQTDKMEKEIEK